MKYPEFGSLFFFSQENLPSSKHKGLTNHEALKNLYDEMSKEIQVQEDKENQQPFGTQCESLQPSKIQSTYHWSGCFIVATIAVLLVITFGISTQKYTNSFIFYFLVKIYLFHCNAIYRLPFGHIKTQSELKFYFFL